MRRSKDSQIYIVACGSAYHVGMAAQYVIEDLTRFRYVWNWHRNSDTEIRF